MRFRSVHPVLTLLWAGPLLVACAGELDELPPTTHTVEIREMAFHPSTLSVNPGDTIVWVNRDFVPHTATAPDSAWTSPPLAQGESWRTVASALESGTYICAFHPVMEASLTIERSSTVQEHTP